MKNVLVKIVNVLCIVIIVIAVILLMLTFFGDRTKGVNILGYYPYRVLTGSMEPQIKTNSFILVEACDITEVEEGEVITFFSRDPSLGGSVNTHRVVKVNDDGGEITLTTKGDANVIEDRYDVYPGDLIGKVVYVSYGIGVALRLLSNPLIFVPIIIIPLLIILILNLRSAIRAAKLADAKAKEEALEQALEEIRRKKAELESAGEDPTKDENDKQ